MGNCLACREAGRSTAATYVVTVYIAGEGQLPRLSCDAHAMLHAVTAIAGGNSVSAMTAMTASRRQETQAGHDPGRGPGLASGARRAVSSPSGWLVRLSRALRRLCA